MSPSLEKMQSPLEKDPEHIEVASMEKSIGGLSSQNSNQAPLEDEIDAKKEKRLVMKQDLMLLPLLALSMMFGYLVCDRLTPTKGFSH